MTAFALPPLAPWQQRIHAQACAALDAGRLGHGLLLCGPAKLGKRLVAEHLAQRLLCTTQRNAGGPVRSDAAQACGQCHACRMFANRSQRDPMEVRPDGTPSHPYGYSTHPDLMLIGYGINERTGKPRSEIVIEQIRGLSESMALTAQYGGAQIVIVDPADAINHAACNALLKTLEEPHPGRYLWLISTDPARLPATIRSRCQRLEFRLPPADEALDWLRTQGHAETKAIEALTAARGHPGLADAWLRDGGLELRREVAGDLAMLTRGERSALETAQRWVAGADIDQRLRHAAELALADAGRATDARRIHSLASWFDAANRTRDLLRTTVRADLAVTELLGQWRQDYDAGVTQRAAGASTRHGSGGRR